MTEFDARTYGNALRILLDGFREEQRGHAAGFLLAELDRLHVAAGNAPPRWINVLRSMAKTGSRPPTPDGGEEESTNPC